MEVENIYTKEARKGRAIQLTNYLHEDNLNEYVAHSGKKCYRIYGPRAYYYLLCDRLRLAFLEGETAYTAEAFAEGVDLEYCEGDITLSFDLMTREQVTNDKHNFNFLEYAYNEKRRAIKITEVAHNKKNDVLFGIWAQDGDKWEVMGYYPDTDAEGK